MQSFESQSLTWEDLNLVEGLKVWSNDIEILERKLEKVKFEKHSISKPYLSP
jgi:hypothetical protein